MKKYIIIAVASILAFSGCSNINDNQNTPQEMTFTAGFSDGVQTRASLYDNMKKVKFDAEDKISILDGVNNNEFTTMGGGASALFSGTATPATTYYAIYPYQAGLSFDGTFIKKLSIPTIQSFTFTGDCGWDPSAPIAYAITTGTSFTFSNLCALLKVTNDQEYVVTITIQDSDNAAIMTGDFDCDISTGTLSENGDDGSSSASGVLVVGVPAKKTVYLAIAPCTVGHLVAKWTYGVSSGGSKTKSSHTTFEAGKIYDLGKTTAWTEPY